MLWHVPEWDATAPPWFLVYPSAKCSSLCRHAWPLWECEAAPHAKGPNRPQLCRLLSACFCCKCLWWLLWQLLSPCALGRSLANLTSSSNYLLQTLKQKGCVSMCSYVWSWYITMHQSVNVKPGNASFRGCLSRDKEFTLENDLNFLIKFFIIK